MWKGDPSDLPKVSTVNVVWGEESWDYDTKHAIVARVVDPATGYDFTRVAGYYSTSEIIVPARTATRTVHFEIDGKSYDQEVTVLTFPGITRDYEAEEVEMAKKGARDSCIRSLQFCVRAAQLLTVKEPR